MEENLELELKYNSVLDIIKDFEYIKYKIYFGLFMLFFVFGLVSYTLFIEKIQIDKSSMYIIFLIILIPFILSILYDFFSRRVKIRIYEDNFEIPVGRPISYQRNNSRNFQRVMKNINI
jgi:hypothetical protein